MLNFYSMAAIAPIFSSRKQMIFSSCYRHFSSTKIQLHEQSRAELLSKGLPKQKPISGCKQILLIASGKGGVGKSTVAVNLAVALKKLEPEKHVGLLDADVFGPSVPLMMNLEETPLLTDDDLMLPLTNYGVKCMSMGNLITKKSAAIWRGIMVMNALNKLIRQVDWAPLDYMIIDTPPGTGDTHLSLIQNLPISGAIIVTTGQKASLEVAFRGITMFEKLKIPIVGIVNNMSSIKCSNCSEVTNIFGQQIEEFTTYNNIKLIANIPLEPQLAECCDNGEPIVISQPKSLQSQAFLSIAEEVSQFLKLSRESHE